MLSELRQGKCSKEV
jgi:hypothetical protein